MAERAAAIGLAALSICESLILSLRDRGLLDDAEASGLLEDAAEAHRNAVSSADDAELHRVAAELIDRIKKGENWVEVLRHLK